MSTSREPVHIAVVGDLPAFDRLEPDDFLDSEEYDLVRLEVDSVAELRERHDSPQLDVAVLDGSVVEELDGFLEQLRRHSPFCESLVVCDPDGEATRRATSSAATEVVVRPRDGDAAGDLIRRALGRMLHPREFPSPCANPSNRQTDLATFRGTSAPFFIADADYRIQYFNRAVNELYRKIHGEDLRVGTSIYRLLPQNDRAGFSVHFDRALDGEEISVQKDVENVDRPDEWHEFVYRPVEDEDGEVVGVGISIRDIEYQKRAEKRLEESEARFWTVFQGAQFGMVITDAEGRIVHANPHFEEIIGVAETKLKAEPLLWFTHPEQRDSASEQLESVHTGERASIRFETRYVDADDQPVWVDVVAWPIRDDGEVQHVVSIVVDITEQKEFEKQIQQAEKMQAVGRLASGFAHEFNNLLMAIVGYAHAIEVELPEGASALRDVQKIASLSEQGGQLTRQLLTYSRQQESNPVHLDLNGAIREMSEMLRRLFDHGIEVDLDLDDDLPPIEADPGRIDQVLMNLALNARDAMPDGGEVTIATRRREIEEPSVDDSISRELGAGVYAELVVRDTGIGMEEETRKRIFEPFFSTKEVGEGTGLGLALVYGVVEDRGGTISVESAPGEGSVFRLYFPESSAQRERRPARAPNEADETTSEARPAPDATVLLVDDEASVRHALGRYLEQRGYRVRTAASPSEARELFGPHGEGIDILLTDVVMPDESGVELAEELATASDDLEVLFLSGYADDELTDWFEDPERRGDLLDKPLSHEAIHRRIAEKLK